MSILAYDLGASGGKALVGRLTDKTMIVEQLHRFANEPVQVGERLHWDILRLYHEMKQGLLMAKHRGLDLESMAITTWAVDFGLIGKNGELLGNPYHYRDRHTDGMMEKLFQEVGRADLFARTGIQFMPINTIYQLYAMRQHQSPLIEKAERLLMISDLLRYFLTGEMNNEFSNATTTQLYNPFIDGWDDALLTAVGVPSSWFAPVVQPGDTIGQIRPSVCAELGIPATPVTIAVEHDTGSAVAAVPAAERNFAYLSCGTWSLMGTEVERPIVNELAYRSNFTNEGGVGRTFRLLKNIMGLWLLQESKRTWEKAGFSYAYDELMRMAEEAPAFAALIDPDDPKLLRPGDIPAQIRELCIRTGQKAPDGPGGIVRCLLESLALKYRYVLEMIERIADCRFNGLHMVGGGINNTLLCQWSANAIGKPVWAGPMEASSVGNLAVQWLAQGQFADIWEARRVVRASFPVVEYVPERVEQWEQAYERFKEMYQSFGHMTVE